VTNQPHFSIIACSCSTLHLDHLSL